MINRKINDNYFAIYKETEQRLLRRGLLEI